MLDLATSYGFKDCLSTDGLNASTLTIYHLPLILIPKYPKMPPISTIYFPLFANVLSEKMPHIFHFRPLLKYGHYGRHILHYIAPFSELQIFFIKS